MSGLQMKYFVLNPRSKGADDGYVQASWAAMQTYAETIQDENPQLYSDLKNWVVNEVAVAQLKYGPSKTIKDSKSLNYTDTD